VDLEEFLAAARVTVRFRLSVAKIPNPAAA
jgi:hypothetical protein